MLAIPRVMRLLSSDHFSVDRTLIEAWASMKRPKAKDDDGAPSKDPPAGGAGRNVEADFHGERRSNATHTSRSDPDARPYRKGRGREAKLSYLGHVLMENRNGLIVEACVTRADGHAECHAALAMIERVADRSSKITMGTDEGLRQPRRRQRAARDERDAAHLRKAKARTKQACSRRLSSSSDR